MPPCCCLLLASVALVLFIAFGGRPLIVLLLGVALLLFIIFLSGPPCLLPFGATLLFITHQCRPAATCYAPMPPCRCLLLAHAVLFLFIAFWGCPAVVY